MPNIYMELAETLSTLAIVSETGKTRIQTNSACPVDKTTVPAIRDSRVDAVGPLPLTKAGNRYLLVLIDFLSRWPIAAEVPDITAESTVDFLTNHSVCHQGVLQRIVSGRGSNFTARYTNHFFENLNTCWKHSKLARPQTNGMVERMNQTLNLTIAKLSSNTESSTEQPIESDKVVNEALMAIRYMPNKTTGYTAAQLLYG